MNASITRATGAFLAPPADPFAEVNRMMDAISGPGPEARNFARIVENNAEWFAARAAEREAEKGQDHG